ncbi:MAG: hypothetical protein KatS3mg105_0530 [Gemmatales bacterium]|nr:MAG: hypothetical protein KatS3mg105_0530 [Gemmatales bacterium]
MAKEKKSKPASSAVGLEEYLIRTIGSLPSNLGLGFLQAVSEAVIDTTRTGVEIAKAPARYSRGQKKEAITAPLEAAADGVLNALKNIVRPLKRSHRIGVQDPDMMDVRDVIKESVEELKQRLEQLGQSLTPEQKKELGKKLREKLKETVPEESVRAQRRIVNALTPGTNAKTRSSSREQQ